MVNQALISSKEKNLKNIFLASRTTGELDSLIETFCKEKSVERQPYFEVFSHSSLRQAYKVLFNYDDIPRTALRYAIERFEEDERKKWLRKEF